MKQLYELDEKVSKDDLPDIYCDMDMVLCDFMKGADKAVGEPFIHADRETRWKKINNTKGFWEGLDNPQLLKLSEREILDYKKGETNEVSKK